jgi:hypothetical protein
MMMEGEKYTIILLQTTSTKFDVNGGRLADIISGCMEASAYLYLYQPTTNVLTFGQSPASGDPEGPSNMKVYNRVNAKGGPGGLE